MIDLNFLYLLYTFGITVHIYTIQSFQPTESTPSSILHNSAHCTSTILVCKFLLDVLAILYTFSFSCLYLAVYSTVQTVKKTYRFSYPLLYVTAWTGRQSMHTHSAIPPGMTKFPRWGCQALSCTIMAPGDAASADPTGSF